MRWPECEEIRSLSRFRYDNMRKPSVGFQSTGNPFTESTWKNSQRAFLNRNLKQAGNFLCIDPHRARPLKIS